MKAKEIMTSNVITVRPDMSIRRLIQLLQKEGITGVPVVDDNDNLVGIVSEKDILRAIDRLVAVYVSLEQARAWKGEHNWVDGIMTKGVITVQEDDPIDEVAKVMSERRIHRVPVVRGQRIVGIISSRPEGRAYYVASDSAERELPPLFLGETEKG